MKVTQMQVGELVLFLENVRNVVKARSTKSAFRLRAQNSRDTIVWAQVLENAINQAASIRVPAITSFTTIADNIFDKYKQTEVHRHNQQNQVHSAVSAKSGNESTTSSAVQSHFERPSAENTEFRSESLSKQNIQVTLFFAAVLKL